LFFLAASSAGASSSASDATLGRFFERNVTRSRDRLRRKAQKAGARPLRVHDARHTLASLTLAAGKRVRWVTSQLGHANPELTLRVYAHALREEETDLSFLDFGGSGDSGGAKRHPGGTAARRGSERPKPPARVREGALDVWSTRPDSNWHSLRTPDMLRMSRALIRSARSSLADRPQVDNYVANVRLVVSGLGGSAERVDCLKQNSPASR